MIKAIIFDYDGVIAESNFIKTEAMGILFEKEGKEIQSKVVKYHLLNEGISREEKFEYFYKNLLKKNYTKKDINHLSKKFSDLVLKKVIDSKKVHGVYDFLENNYKNYLFFISTGTPNEEINKIIRKTNMKKFFKLCLGSPEKKEDHISLILKDFLLKKEQLLFVGDSLTDIEAAKNFNIDFILRLHSGNKILAKERNLRVVKDFNDLEILLKTNYS